jgi:hypothetical protein
LKTTWSAELSVKLNVQNTIFRVLKQI